MRKKALHLGCGNDVYYDDKDTLWWNLDLDVPACGARTMSVDVLEVGDYFPAGHFNHIYSKFLFEHLTVEQILDLLYQIHSIMAPKGTMIVEVPDFEAVVRDYEMMARVGPLSFEDVALYHYRIFGDPRTTHHKSIWTVSSGVRYLQMDDRFAVVQTLPPKGDDVDRVMRFVCNKK